MGELPEGFSSKTGQGRWSDRHTGHNWCICIWAYANYITQHEADELPIQCDAIPEQVCQRKLLCRVIFVDTLRVGTTLCLRRASYSDEKVANRDRMILGFGTARQKMVILE